MDWSSTDLPQAFRKFRALSELIFDGPLSDKSEEVKVKYLLIWTGEEGIELVSTWHLTAEEKKKLDTYWTKFEKYVKPKSNFRLARYKLRGLKQEPTESADQFMKRVRIIISECKYLNTNDHMIDALIFGTNSQSVQSKLLQKDDKLTLDEALDIARTEEATKQQLSDISGEQAVHAMYTRHARPAQKMKEKSCNRCGREHRFKPRSECPAYGTTCNKCKKMNHWEKCCRSEPTSQANSTNANSHQSHRNVHAIESLPQEDVANLFFHELKISSLDQHKDTQALLRLTVEGEKRQQILCKLDTGAEGNVIPAETYKTLFPKCPTNSSGEPTGLTRSSTVITAYGGNKVPHYGTCRLNVSHREAEEASTFHVVRTSGPTIIGLPSCRALGLIQLTYDVNILKDGDRDERTIILEEYTDCFKGIGCFEGEYDITLDPTVDPVVHAPRRVPVALQEPLKAELERLVLQGIIAPVEKPTDWVNSIVCTTKSDGTIRLCLDPKDLNKAVKRPYHATRTLDDILPKLNGAKHFSILDARSGYWNVMLSENSSYMTTFNTPHGRYRFRRLPFGLSCAQDVFQRKVDETFGDLTGVCGIADDIVVVGYKEDGSDHDANLRAVLQRARDRGLRFNPDKLKVKCQQIKFFGNIIGANGLEADPEKVKAIKEMKPPKDVQELQTFLGLATYLGRFTDQLATLAAPLRDLCKKDAHFAWCPEHQKAFHMLKEALTSQTVLQYFDEKKDVTIQVDASQHGLGAALLQEKGPVEYASKSLSDTETRYSNIEREMLGVLFGLERFHYYAYGRHVTVETDHKPLASIIQKNLNHAPPRIARMLLRIQKYDITIKYIPGKQLQLADALSRVTPCAGDEIKGLDITIHEVHLNINASPTRIQSIKQETATDDDLQQLMSVIMNGWPDERTSCPATLIEYWNYRDELYVEDGMVLKGERVLIPKTLQAEVLKQLHYAHQGIEKCRLRARGSVYWVNLNKDIEQMVKTCQQCQEHMRANQKEPLMPHDVPKHPWHTLASDLFHLDNANYLLVADYHSKFPIVKRLNSTVSSAVIQKLKETFSEFGIPSKLMTDNGPQYSSYEFKKFCDEYGFQHVTSSPRYPQSNGFIERMVQTIKSTLQKASDPYLAMLCLRTTPVAHDMPSPCMLLNKRQYQSNLPSVASHADGDINKKLEQRQDKQKHYYDKHAKELPPLVKDEPVRMWREETSQWEPATVKHAANARSYHIETTDGQQYRRNRRHLRQSYNSKSVTPVPCDDHEVLATETPTQTLAPGETSEVRRSTRVRCEPKYLEDYVNQ